MSVFWVADHLHVFFHTFCIKGCLNVSPIPDWPVWQLFIDGTKAYKTSNIINSTYCTLNFEFFFVPFQCPYPLHDTLITRDTCLNGSTSVARNAGKLWTHHRALAGISARLPNQLMCTSAEICTVSCHTSTCLRLSCECVLHSHD